MRAKHSIEAVGIFGALALGLVGWAPALAQPERRDLRIDGSSEAKFEASVGALLNELPGRRREDVEIALAVIWMSNSLGAAGLDRDGDGVVSVIDSRPLAEGTLDLLTDIRRGDLLASIETREQKGSQYAGLDQRGRIERRGSPRGAGPDPSHRQQTRGRHSRVVATAGLSAVTDARAHGCDTAAARVARAASA